MFEHVIDHCHCRGKWCSGCEQIKSHGAFNRLKKAKSGLQPYCRDCQSAMYKEYYQNNLERERARNRGEGKREYYKTWRRDNADNRREYDKAYNEANAERRRAFRSRNANKHRAQAKAYAQSHLKERTIYEKNRRARKLQAGGTFTHQEWKVLCKYYDYTCLRRGRREPDIELTVDHVIPLSMGGSNSIDNIQPLCHSCNARKRTKTVDYRKEWESRN